MKSAFTKISSYGLIGAAVLLPILAHAQTTKKLSNIIDLVVDYIEQALFLIMAVAILIFIIQVIRYFILPNESRKEAGMYVMYSVIGFFVIFSLWGLVNVLANTFDVGNNTTNKPQSWSNFTNIFPSN